MGFGTQDVERKMLTILKVLIGGLNPAAAEEAGVDTENHAMSTVVEYQNLIKFEEL